MRRKGFFALSVLWLSAAAAHAGFFNIQPLKPEMDSVVRYFKGRLDTFEMSYYFKNSNGTLDSMSNGNSRIRVKYRDDHADRFIYGPDTLPSYMLRVYFDGGYNALRDSFYTVSWNRTSPLTLVTHMAFVVGTSTVYRDGRIVRAVQRGQGGDTGISREYYWEYDQEGRVNLYRYFDHWNAAPEYAEHYLYREDSVLVYDGNDNFKELFFVGPLGLPDSSWSFWKGDTAVSLYYHGNLAGASMGRRSVGLFETVGVKGRVLGPGIMFSWKEGRFDARGKYLKLPEKPAQP